MSDLLSDLLRLKIEAAGAAADSADVLAALIRSRLDVRADGAVKVLDAAGNVRVGGGPGYGDMSLDEAVAELAASKPVLFGRAAPVPVEPPAARQEAPESESATLRVAREGRERKAASAAARAAKPDVNPWAEGAFNVTMQVLLTARDPERAARMKSEAAKRP